MVHGVPFFGEATDEACIMLDQGDEISRPETPKIYWFLRQPSSGDAYLVPYALKLCKIPSVTATTGLMRVCLCGFKDFLIFNPKLREDSHVDSCWHHVWLLAIYFLPIGLKQLLDAYFIMYCLYILCASPPCSRWCHVSPLNRGCMRTVQRTSLGIRLSFAGSTCEDWRLLLFLFLGGHHYGWPPPMLILWDGEFPQPKSR